MFSRRSRSSDVASPKLVRHPSSNRIQNLHLTLIFNTYESMIASEIGYQNM